MASRTERRRKQWLRREERANEQRNRLRREAHAVRIPDFFTTDPSETGMAGVAFNASIAVPGDTISISNSPGNNGTFRIVSIQSTTVEFEPEVFDPTILDFRPAN